MTTDPHFESRSPVVRSEKIQVTRAMDVSGGLSIWQPVHFEVDLLWLRRSECRVLVLAEDGRILKEGSTFNDFYGFLTSPKEPLERAPGYVRTFGATPTGPVEVRVAISVTEKPVLAGTKAPAFHTLKTYRCIPNDWIRRGDDAMVVRWLNAPLAERLADGSLRPDFIAPRALLTDHALWSSRLAADPVAQEAAFASLEGDHPGVLSGLDEAALAKATGDVLPHLRKLARGSYAELGRQAA